MISCWVSSRGFRALSASSAAGPADGSRWFSFSYFGLAAPGRKERFRPYRWEEPGNGRSDRRRRRRGRPPARSTDNVSAVSPKEKEIDFLHPSHQSILLHGIMLFLSSIRPGFFENCRYYHHTIHPDLTFYCLEKQNFSCFSDFAGYPARFIPLGKMPRSPRGAISLNPAAGLLRSP